MYARFTAILGLASVAAHAVAAGVVAARNVAEPLSPGSALATCSWTGYGQTLFRDSYGPVGGSSGQCYFMPGNAWESALFSAKVNTGGSVCLYTGKTSCSGTHQVIDTAGYRDMTNLPAFYTWHCGAC